MIAAQAIEGTRRITQQASEASQNPAQAGSRPGALLEQRSPTALVLDGVWEKRVDPFLIGGHRCAPAHTPLRPEA
ncbi:hypothetical protein ABZ557_17950 [Streptomyces sp. NPDC019645]|uniref:hypothetical protein n=1 Tax=Streptomyces sp. NPDC019645 TaxID=3154786 RepID=UPI00340198EE